MNYCYRCRHAREMWGGKDTIMCGKHREPTGVMRFAKFARTDSCYKEDKRFFLLRWLKLF